jgi:hypothetical protein
MDKIYAQILNGVVVNIIILNDSTLEPLFAQGFDACIQIDQLSPQPGIGWSYDGQSFTPPSQV